MNGFLDDLLVGLVLLAAVGYAIYALGPKALRPRLLVGLSSLLGRLPAFLGLRGIANRLATAARSAGEGSCGGCDNCGSESPPTAQGSRAEFRIPLTKIGKRR